MNGEVILVETFEAISLSPASLRGMSEPHGEDMTKQSFVIEAKSLTLIPIPSGTPHYYEAATAGL